MLPVISPPGSIRLDVCDRFTLDLRVLGRFAPADEAHLHDALKQLASLPLGPQHGRLTLEQVGLVCERARRHHEDSSLFLTASGHQLRDLGLDRDQGSTTVTAAPPDARARDLPPPVHAVRPCTARSTKLTIPASPGSTTSPAR